VSDEYTAKYANIPNVTPGIMDALLGEYNTLKPWLTGEERKRVLPQDMHAWARNELPGILDGSRNEAGPMEQWAADLAIGAMAGGPGLKPPKKLAGLLGKEKGLLVGDPAYKEMKQADLESALDFLRRKNEKKSLPRESGTGGIRDEIARRHAVEDLGLPENHIAADRAAAFRERVTPVPLYHGTSNDFGSFDPKLSGKTSGTALPGVSTAENPNIADMFANFSAGAEMRDAEGIENVIGTAPYDMTSSPQPLFLDPQTGNAVFDGTRVLPLTATYNRAAQFSLPARPNPFQISGTIRHAFDGPHDLAIMDNYNTMPGINQEKIVVLKDPSQLRSRFAAFDPRRRNESDLLAGMVPAGLLGASLASDDAQSGGLMQSLASQAQDPSNTLVAHIMPSEADALKRKNGGGSINPVTGLPEFWSDGGGSEDGDSYGGGRRGGNAGFSDTSEGSSWGGGDGGWGGGWSDSLGDIGRSVGESMGSWRDGISNTDATRAKEARADMLSGPESLTDTVNRAAMGEIMSDDQARQQRATSQWGGAKEFRDFPGQSWGQKTWDKMTRMDNVVGGLFGLAGSLTGIPGAGFLGSKLGGYIAKDWTPASTVANLDRTKGYVSAGYPGMNGPLESAAVTGMGGYGKRAGDFSGMMDNDSERLGRSSDYIPPPEQKQETPEEKKKREDGEKKKLEEQMKMMQELFGLPEAKEGDGEETGQQTATIPQASTPGWSYDGLGFFGLSPRP